MQKCNNCSEEIEEVMSKFRILWTHGYPVRRTEEETRHQGRKRLGDEGRDGEQQKLDLELLAQPRVLEARQEPVVRLPQPPRDELDQLLPRVHGLPVRRRHEERELEVERYGEDAVPVRRDEAGNLVPRRRRGRPEEHVEAQRHALSFEVLVHVHSPQASQLQHRTPQPFPEIILLSTTQSWTKDIQDLKKLIFEKQKKRKKSLCLGNQSLERYPPITYYWTVPLILDHTYLVGKLTSSKIAETKVSGF